MGAGKQFSSETNLNELQTQTATFSNTPAVLPRFQFKWQYFLFPFYISRTNLHNRRCLLILTSVIKTARFRSFIWAECVVVYFWGWPPFTWFTLWNKTVSGSDINGKWRYFSLSFSLCYTRRWAELNDPRKNVFFFLAF